MRKIGIVLMLVLISGCGSSMSQLLDEARAHNRASLSRLSIGMSKSEALEVMGTTTMRLKDYWGDVRIINNPYRVEAVKGYDGEMYEILFYYTDLKKQDGAVTDDELTPLVIKDDKLIGWGWRFVSDNVTKYQIDIR